MSATIPGFLLPRLSTIWFRQPGVSRTIPCGSRSITRAAKSKPTATSPASHILEKPSQFNPPSHGSKLRSPPRSYPGPRLTQEEETARRTKQYPNMMPPPGTWWYWFLTSRQIHVWITLGTLSTLAIGTFVTNFKRTSKFADLLPSWGESMRHPVDSVGQLFEVLRLHVAATGAETHARRQRNVDDVAKRDAFRKAHGMDTDGIGGWSAKGVVEDIGAVNQPNTAEQSNATPVATANDGGLQDHVVQQQSKRPLKKWLGIW